MKALIIGAAGFVGGHLIRHLSDELGFEVYATKLSFEKTDADCAGIFDLDILDAEAVSDLLCQLRPDYIYHLAAQSSVKMSWSNPQLTADVNIKGTLNVLESVRKLDFKTRILLVGSGEEYGFVRPEEVPVNEETTLRAGNIYAVTKACQGMLGEVYTRAYKLDIIMVRAFNHIGPGQADIFVVSDFCKQAVLAETGKKKPVIRVGNLSAKRDFTDVRDIVKAYSSLMKSGMSGETYNVGSGKSRSIQQMLDMILERSETDISVEIDTSRMRPSDVPVIEADISKLSETTGWFPTIPIEQTIDDMMNYWREKEKI